MVGSLLPSDPPMWNFSSHIESRLEIALRWSRCPGLNAEDLMMQVKEVSRAT